MNGDGKPDVVTANSADGTFSVLLGTGAGTLRAATSTRVQGDPYSVAIADFDGDAKPDVATAIYSRSTVNVVLSSCPP